MAAALLPANNEDTRAQAFYRGCRFERQCPSTPTIALPPYPDGKLGVLGPTVSRRPTRQAHVGSNFRMDAFGKSELRRRGRKNTSPHTPHPAPECMCISKQVCAHGSPFPHPAASQQKRRPVRLHPIGGRVCHGIRPARYQTRQGSVKQCHSKHTTPRNADGEVDVEATQQRPNRSLFCLVWKIQM